MNRTEKSKKRISLVLFSVLILSYTYVCMTKYCFSSAMVFIEKEGYMTNFQTGLISSAFWLVYAISQLFGGTVADKWHPERLITFGLIAAGIANVAVYLCYENYTLTLVIWMLNALCQFGVWPAVFKLISTMYSGRQLSNAMMIATLASPAGLMLNYAVAAVVPHWQDNFVVSFIGLFTLALIWWLTSRSSKDYIASLDLTGKAKLPSGAQEKDSNISTSKLFYVSGIAFIFALAFFRSLVENMKSFVPSMISAEYVHVDPSMSTFMTLIPLFCGAAAPVFSNFLSKKVENEMRVVTCIFVAILPVSLVTLLIGQINYWFIIGAMALVTFGSGASTFFITTLIAAKFNKWGKGATAAGLINAFTAIGNVVASALVTWIADNFSWRMSLLALVIFIVITLAVSLLELPIWKRFKRNYYYEKE